MLKGFINRSIATTYSKDIVICGYKRTPFGSLLGSLKSHSAVDLATGPLKALLQENPGLANHVDYCIIGNVLSAGLGQNAAKQVVHRSGLPPTVDTLNLNKLCSSGLKSVTFAADQIALGNSQVAIAGGMESMTNAPYLIPNMRAGQAFGDGKLLDTMWYDGLTCGVEGTMMGACCEQTMIKYGVTREMNDAFAIESYKRSQNAQQRGYFAEEIVPVQGKTEVSQDEEPAKIKFEKIAGLRPVFAKEGTITAANASTINDGAALLIVSSLETAKQVGLVPLARIISHADNEHEPVHFASAPVGAIQKALNKAGLQKSQVDLWEINEAFSGVVVVAMQQLELNHSRVNVNGGAVSLGHPIGASGARILGTLIRGLQEKGGAIGVAGICNGGGGATAAVVELI